MLTDRAASVADSISLAREDFHLARFDAAAQRLYAAMEGAADSAEPVLLTARVELRRGHPGEALSLLTRFAKSMRSRFNKAESSLLKGVSFARLGDSESAHAQFDSAGALLSPADELHSELIYQTAAALWIERHLETANATLEKLPPHVSRDLDLQARILKGAIASANENLHAQGAILLASLAQLRGTDPNVYLYAMLVTQVAALAVELPSAELRDAANEHLSKVRWTPDIGDLHFHALRAVAWRHALDGDEFNAFRRLKEALSVTRSTAWRVAALADRAYLASALGEHRWAAQELRDAHELASTMDWASVAGEEKLALPVLAEMFARRDPSVAINYAAAFRNAGNNYPRVLSSHQDRRVDALEAYSLGKVQLELGEIDEARRLLSRAWEIYDRLGIQWRAARAALALAEIGDERWRERAERSLQAYPRSWLLRKKSREADVRSSTAPQLERLTPAQRAVFNLLMNGRGTAQIAKELERSTFTVRNHIKAIFKVFGVTSRPALIVKASQLTAEV